MSNSGRRPAAPLGVAEIKALVRTIPDFPAKGIRFRDVTTLIANGPGLASTIAHLARRAEGAGAEAVAGIEARGFVFGAALAARLGTGFVPLRKAGKLPVETISCDYQLEYGAARLELDPTMVSAGERVLLVDDLIATGGTAIAATRLLRRAGAVVEQALFVIDLPDLGGAEALRAEHVEAHALIAYEGR